MAHPGSLPRLSGEGAAASDQHVRAVMGGLGAAKTAGNYAASLFGAEEAQKAGYTQVLWLGGVEHRYLDEVGTMNIMLKIDDEVITPPLNGAILAGVTRDSVLRLLRDGECGCRNGRSRSMT
jgi:branched-chain amino acid aminotransferase